MNFLLQAMNAQSLEMRLGYTSIKEHFDNTLQDKSSNEISYVPPRQKVLPSNTN